jgi:hypothetical protein
LVFSKPRGAPPQKPLKGQIFMSNVNSNQTSANNQDQFITCTHDNLNATHERGSTMLKCEQCDEPMPRLEHSNNTMYEVLSLDDVGITTPRTAKYIERYCTFAKKTAEAFIEMAVTYAEAKVVLDCVELKSFSKSIGVDSNSATSVRLIKIDNEQGRFLPHLSRLPSAYTTLYQLARLDAPRFEALANSDKLTPFLTAKDIEEFCNKSASGSNLNSKGTKNAFIGFDSLVAKDKAEFWSKIIRIAQQYVSLPTSSSAKAV